MNLLKNTVINNNHLTPTEFYLSQNYPTPFSERTTIKFCVAYKTKVKLEVFNSNGELVKTLLDEEKEAGTYEVEFSTVGMRHASFAIMAIPAGVYRYQLEAGDYWCEKQMEKIK
jgi:hypothetical protein